MLEQWTIFCELGKGINCWMAYIFAIKKAPQNGPKVTCTKNDGKVKLILSIQSPSLFAESSYFTLLNDYQHTFYESLSLYMCPAISSFIYFSQSLLMTTFPSSTTLLFHLFSPGRICTESRSTSACCGKGPPHLYGLLTSRPELSYTSFWIKTWTFLDILNIVEFICFTKKKS